MAGGKFGMLTETAPKHGEQSPVTKVDLFIEPPHQFTFEAGKAPPEAQVIPEGKCVVQKTDSRKPGEIRQSYPTDPSFAENTAKSGNESNAKYGGTVKRTVKCGPGMDM